MLYTSKFVEINKNKIVVKKITNFVIILLDFFYFPYTKNKYLDILKHYYTYTFITFFLRFIWRGKAYRVRLFKKNTKLTLNFGYSHWCKLKYNIQFFKLSKIKRQNYLIFFTDRWENFYIRALFNKLRIYNRYTRRGIRLKKNPYIRRFGKISQVNSSLHSY